LERQLGQGTLTFDDIVFQTGFLGSYSQLDNSWLWSYANPNMSTLPDSVTAAARQLRELGESRDIPLFSNDAIHDIDEDECRRLAMVVVGLLPGCGGYYPGPYGNGNAYLLVQQPLPTDRSIIRLQRVVMECATLFHFRKRTHHDAVMSFFRSEGLEIKSSEPTSIAAIGVDGTIQVTFDEHGRIKKASGVL
jgi:hypothetical protein